jgi:hypothetical protein
MEKKKKMRYVNYVNDGITEMHKDERRFVSIRERNLKVNVHHFSVVCLHNDGRGGGEEKVLRVSHQRSVESK